jgi:collagenase-like PrtC family protease
VLEKTPVEIEVFGFGSLCVMVEGRCALSSYVTGEAPNTNGVCSPPKAVRWQETAAGPRIAPEWRADRPLRTGRKRRLPHAVQRPL